MELTEDNWNVPHKSFLQNPVSTVLCQEELILMDVIKSILLLYHSQPSHKKSENFFPSNFMYIVYLKYHSAWSLSFLSSLSAPLPFHELEIIQCFIPREEILEELN